jgi:predicted PurR-regulated permease PerM
MDDPAASQRGYRPLIAAGLLLAMVAALALAKTVLIPVALAILLSFVLTPAVKALQNRGLRRLHAVLVVVLLTLLISGGVIAAISAELRGLATILPDRKGNIEKKFDDVLGGGPGVLGNLVKMLDELDTHLHEATEPGTPTRAVPAGIPVINVQQPPPERTSRLSLLLGLGGSVVSTVGSIGLIIALTVAMLVMREDLRNRLIRLIGDDHLTSTTRALDDATRRISRYLILQLIINAGFGALLGLGLAVLRVEYAFLWGFLACVLRFIPFVGTWVAIAFPVLFSLAAADWVQPLLVVVYGIVLGIVVNNVVEPQLLSRNIGLSPVALVLSAAFWTWLWGPIGLVLATPMTVCLSVLGRYVPPLRFLDVLLGVEPALDPEQGYYQRLLARDVGEAAQLLDQYLEKHSFEEACDDVLLPALVRARADEERGQLSAAETAFIVQATQELTDGLLQDRPAASDKVAALFLACPAHDAREELALRLFEHLAAAAGGKMVLTGSKATAAEVVQRVADERPCLVLIATMPPRTTAQARYLCKRLRARFPSLPVVVGCWGGPEDPALVEQLRAAGASQVATTLRESGRQVAPLLQVVPKLELQEA